ncbi:DUF389 domain-containing protein [Epilithonimonas ginsengisoli]|uniref:DUF389 domain-containing protein n=1 Tax=Epilithonimonas ginsengisoli TaxID=1245592 RepID=A0ABU4JMP1_9FLAO|nr:MULTISPECIES: DUF389 domain-containing protein [Chryseobacterium group]MBV6881904.1 DUF389 domain-containing protein [Epilithonimonas sp. FP105]MDW8550962.1 DUF389 domain-containing protein [Epilithonimonas ginsengisoli]OAH69804.1 hypothetical protein AXA65_14355 [Chryseobacterium sp. FP211-J200]
MNNIFNFINLHNGEEKKDKVLENVTSNISFRGSNLWILACAIIIASIGLNVNSTAVIIGAMLISPLMGPIVGAGFALGTYNFPLLKKSFKNLIIATVVSLLVSGFYFYISPFKDVQSELLARTAPNIYDVLIAFFGGLVGVIAITRVEKGNPIPGVAIATALMPPLCTAGFGLATFNFSYFLGAFYLYTINCFFICIATFLVVKYLHYPSSIVDSKYEKRIRYSISFLILVMIVPSSYLAYNLYNEKKFTKTAEIFLQKEFEKNGYTLIYKKINYNANPKTIDVAFLNKKFTAEEIKSYNKMLSDNGLANTKINIRQNNSDLKSEILSEINKNNTTLSEKDIALSSLRSELDNYKVSDSTLGKEIQILYPDMSGVSYGKIAQYPETDSARLQFVMIYSGKKVNDLQLKSWLEKRLNEKNVKLLNNSEN